MSTFYKVRRKDTKMFYEGGCKLWEFPFHPHTSEKGKRFDSLKEARQVVKLCGSFYPLEVVEYIEQTLEIGTISPRGKLTLTLNQIAT